MWRGAGGLAALALLVAAVCGGARADPTCTASLLRFYCDHSFSTTQYYECNVPYFSGWRDCNPGTYCTTAGEHTTSPCTMTNPSAGTGGGSGGGGTSPIWVCGDGVCSAFEHCQSCPADCPCAPRCGDGVCTPGVETCSTCPQECGMCPCGDGICNGAEGCLSCPADCGACFSTYCGDGLCAGAESCSSCIADCGTCWATQYCGDRICNNGETCSSCAIDCGACSTGGGSGGSTGGGSGGSTGGGSGGSTGGSTGGGSSLTGPGVYTGQQNAATAAQRSGLVVMASLACVIALMAFGGQ